MTDLAAANPATILSSSSKIRRDDSGNSPPSISPALNQNLSSAPSFQLVTETLQIFANDGAAEDSIIGASFAAAGGDALCCNPKLKCYFSPSLPPAGAPTGRYVYVIRGHKVWVEVAGIMDLDLRNVVVFGDTFTVHYVFGVLVEIGSNQGDNMSRASLFFSCAVLILIVSGSLARTINKAPNEAPMVVAAVAPILPPIARQARVEGDVKVEVKVDRNGTVQSTKVISGHPLVQKASETAATKWKFSALGQEPSVRTVQLIFRFDCVDKDKLAADSTITFIPPYEVEVKY